MVEPSPVPAAEIAIRASVERRPPHEPKLKTLTQTYPAAVVYILYREYLHQNPKLTSLSPENPRYQVYLERRLRELYPTRGYSGMMRDAVKEVRENEATWRKYESELRTYEASTQDLIICEPEIQGAGPGILTTTCPGSGGTGSGDPSADPSWSGQQEFAVPPDSAIPTIQMEIDTLQLAGEEVDRIYYFESLATGTYRPVVVESVGENPSIDDLIRAAGEGRTPGTGDAQAQVLPPVGAVVYIGLGVVGWKAIRAWEAADRAKRKSYEYYPTLAYDDTRRDAHRHMFWSQMLRRYIGATLAKMITDKHEEGGSGPSYVMDLHNNDIGRSYRYERFRGHWLWDKWDWQEWGRRIRDYVNEPTHATFIPELSRFETTTEEAWQREASVPNTSYIYFRN